MYKMNLFHSNCHPNDRQFATCSPTQTTVTALCGLKISQISRQYRVAEKSEQFACCRGERVAARADEKLYNFGDFEKSALCGLSLFNSIQTLYLQTVTQ